MNKDPFELAVRRVLMDASNASSQATRTFLTTAASPGTSSATCPGKSCPSDCATGRTGSNQRDVVIKSLLQALLRRFAAPRKERPVKLRGGAAPAGHHFPRQAVRRGPRRSAFRRPADGGGLCDPDPLQRITDNGELFQLPERRAASLSSSKRPALSLMKKPRRAATEG
jgi:hypothetical protein